MSYMQSMLKDSRQRAITKTHSALTNPVPSRRHFKHSTSAQRAWLEWCDFTCATLVITSRLLQAPIPLRCRVEALKGDFGPFFYTYDYYVPLPGSI